VNQLAAGGADEEAAGHVPSPELHLLRECSGIGELVTLDASNIVVRWSEAIFYCLPLGEDKQVVFEASFAAFLRRFWLRNALVDWGASVAETVEEVVGLGIHISGQSLLRALSFDGARKGKGNNERHREENQH
jgi:hypothetical protein